MEQSLLHPKPHDHFVKQAMSNVEIAKDFFEIHLPSSVKSQIDLGTLNPIKDCFASKELGTNIVDMLFSVKHKQYEKGYISILVEHQTKPERFMPLRFIKYMTGICHMHLKQNPKAKYLPLIYPMLYYTGMRPYKHTLNLWELFHDPDAAKAYFTEPVQLIDIHSLEDEDLKRQALSGVMSYIMKHRANPEILQTLLPLKPFLKLIGRKHPLYLIDIVCYLLDVCDTKQSQQTASFFEEVASEECREHVMNITGRIKQEGILKGKQEAFGNIMDAMEMIKSHQSIQTIVQKTGLAAEEIQQIIYKMRMDQKEPAH